MSVSTQEENSTLFPSAALKGKRALIFGGTGGIGYACGRAFLAAGVQQLMIIGRNAERAEKAAAALNSEFDSCDVRFTASDAATSEGATRGVQACVDAFGGVDILLSSAGGDPMPGLFHTLPIESLPDIVGSSMMPAILPARAVLDTMMAQGKGVILTVASDAGKVATPGETAIGAAMAGIIMFTRSLANEAKRSNIRVNCLSPSIVRSTALYDNLMADAFASKLFSKAEKMASLGVVEPEDIAAMAVYLASPAAAKISGQVVSINGGISMA